MSLAHAKVQELCRQLGLDDLALDFATVAERAAKEELPFTEFLEQALRVELQARLHRNRTMMTRVAGFPAVKTLEDFDLELSTTTISVGVTVDITGFTYTQPAT